MAGAFAKTRNANADMPLYGSYFAVRYLAVLQITGTFISIYVVGLCYGLMSAYNYLISRSAYPKLASWLYFEARRN